MYNKIARPFLKWAGGKRQLLPELKKLIPPYYNTYFEPFVGAGALLFHLQPQKAFISDTNEELINCYHVIKDSLNELLADLKKHINKEEYYYKIRALDRDEEEFSKLSSVKKASRIIYLNKTCYNGLFRVNSQGQFNVPFGRYKNPKFVDEIVLKAVSEYLNNNDVMILNDDFEKVLQRAKKDDFVYFDPPYDPISETANFTSYAINGFDKEEQQRLKRVYAQLTSKGVNCLLSNSSTEFILDLYKEYEIVPVSVSRSINSVPYKRGKAAEVIVKNW
jgi:DNA adenine methylase